MDKQEAMIRRSRVTARLNYEIDRAEITLIYADGNNTNDLIEHLEFLLDAEEIIDEAQPEVKKAYNRNRERNLIKKIRGY